MYAGHLDLTQPLVWTVDDAFTREECAALVARVEGIGFEAAAVNLPGGQVIRPDIRNNARVMLRDEELAAQIFARTRGRFPERLQGMEAVGANELLRFYRYSPGQRFAPHTDGCYVRDERERSLLTLMVYLNDGFEGGATEFAELGQTVVPRTGMALLFQHGVLHEGCVVTGGTKYAVRSDVMYRARSRPSVGASLERPR
jgi:prolyl 4-hydroxylase